MILAGWQLSVSVLPPVYPPQLLMTLYHTSHQPAISMGGYSRNHYNAEILVDYRGAEIIPPNTKFSP